MKIGFHFPTRPLTLNEGPSPDLRPLLMIAEQAEEFGFDYLMAGDLVLTKLRSEALSILSACAARTKRIFLGTGVYLPLRRNPLLLAH